MLCFIAVKSIVLSISHHWSRQSQRMCPSFEIYVYILSREETQVQFLVSPSIAISPECHCIFLASDVSKTSKLSFVWEFCQLLFRKGDSYKRSVQILLQGNLFIKAVLFVEPKMIERLGCIRNFPFTQL